MSNKKDSGGSSEPTEKDEQEEFGDARDG